MFFAYTRHGAPTGIVLADALGIRHGDYLPEAREDILIRWGNRGSSAYRATHVFNSRGAISNASNKYCALEKMFANNVPVPKFSTSCRELRAPFLGRTLNHSRGEDIVLCMQQSDGERAVSDYYIEYIPTAKEYRVHVFGDRIIHAARKTLRNGDDYLPWIRNHTHGFVFLRLRAELTPLQEHIALSAVRALRLTFGAVDLIVGDDGQTYVLEVNTAPSLSPQTAQAYVDAMAQGIRTVTGQIIEPNYEVLSSLQNEEDEPENDNENEA